MFRFFRSLRRRLIERNSVTNYMLYAFGEVVLVVIGILIALQINNWNDGRKARDLELKYLTNIRADLVNNIAEIDRLAEDRRKGLADANAVIATLESGSIDDVHEFNLHCVHVYEWQRFMQINYTVEELISSGNLALISNTDIKSSLLRLEAAYKTYKAEEDHFRFDSEELLYKPIYAHLDLHPMLRDYMGEADVLPHDYFEVFWSDPKFKNGFLMVILEFTKMDEQLVVMRDICEELIEAIDEEGRS